MEAVVTLVPAHNLAEAKKSAVLPIPLNELFAGNDSVTISGDTITFDGSLLQTIAKIVRQNIHGYDLYVK
jgi:hypothetical protein